MDNITNITINITTIENIVLNRDYEYEFINISCNSLQIEYFLIIEVTDLNLVFEMNSSIFRFYA